MNDDPSPHRDARWAGSYALAAGFASVVCTLLPAVSEVVAGPLALIAIVLGLVGIRLHSVKRAARVAPAIIGLMLGAVALFIVVLMLAASL
ncbi:hypothetical protein [Agrococcus beijingensis]|uniref:hypothetical protein n=1 Tax=Agrococcus beijingensis TaxID=3068634 RepID=UPI002740466A|nr:hypothetical protein [Agrococcus sp. REN33]